MTERVPPHDHAAEVALLGAILLSGDALTAVADLVAPRHFWLPAHRAIFAAMLALCEAGQPIDQITLADRLRRDGGLNEAGGAETILALTDGYPSAVNARAWAALIRQKALVRDVIAASRRIAADGYADPDDPDAYAQEAQAALFAAARDTARAPFRPLGEVLTASIRDLEARQKEADAGGRAHTGIPSGFYDLDDKTDGFQRGDLCILAARPGMGKTALALNAAAHAASLGFVVGVFSLEMTSEQLALRLIAARARVSSSALRGGRLTDPQWLGLTDAAGDIGRWPIYLDDTSGLTPGAISAKCRQIAARAGRLDLAVVDYIQLMGTPEGKRFQNRETEISYISRSLKALAKDLAIPVLALSQLNREVEKRGDKRPQLSDLRESGAIEQDADLILFVHREAYYNKEDPLIQNDAELLLSKHRNGPTGIVPLRFFGESVRFENAARA